MGSVPLPPVLFPVGSCYCGVRHWGLPRLDLAPLGLMPGVCVWSQGTVFPPGALSLALSNLHLLPGFCELIREQEGEEGDAACLPRYLQQSTVTNAPSW